MEILQGKTEEQPMNDRRSSGELNIDRPSPIQVLPSQLFDPAKADSFDDGISDCFRRHTEPVFLDAGHVSPDLFPNHVLQYRQELRAEQRLHRQLSDPGKERVREVGGSESVSICGTGVGKTPPARATGRKTCGRLESLKSDPEGLPGLT
nr:hypothetical protein Iba_chr03eCG4050 [Ipomoea batatas]